MDRSRERLEQSLKPAVRVLRLVADQIPAGNDEVRPQAIDDGNRLSEIGGGIDAVLAPLRVRQDVEIRHMHETEIRVSHATLPTAVRPR